MFVVNEDNSIYVTRGDAGTISVSAKVDGANYVFRAGDVVRFKVTQKKACENVVLQKDFPITVDTEIVDIYLSEKDTKIGDVISKPVDYWYEVELNPFTNPQTIIGYDDDGAKIFKLHPEGRDLVDEPTTEEEVPVVDTDLSLTSSKPVENKVIARAVTNLNSNIATLEGKLAEEKKTRETQQANLQSTLTKKTSEITSDVNVLEARMNTFTALPEGSTTADSELIDIRNGADGTVYSSAGDAVRSQVANLKSDLGKVNDDMTDLFPNKDVYNLNVLYFDNNTAERYVNPNTGQLNTNADYTALYYSEIKPNTEYKLSCTNQHYGAWYDENKTYISGINHTVTWNDHIITSPENAKYIKLSCQTAYLNTLSLIENCDLFIKEDVKILSKQIVGASETILTVGNGKQFSTLKDAFANCINASEKNKYIVEFYGSGTGVEYDLGAEITEAELADSSFIGLTVPKHTTLKGVGGKDKCILVLRLTAPSSAISALNLYGSSSLEGVTVISKNTRYTVHDDYADAYTTKTVKNCKFISEYSTYLSVWGAGYRQGNEFYFENCEFISNGANERALSIHNNKGMEIPARIYFHNCRFVCNHESNVGVTFQTMRNNTFSTINEFYLYGCKLGKLTLAEENATLYGAGILTKVYGYGNDLKTADVVISNTDGADYSDYVDLI